MNISQARKRKIQWTTRMAFMSCGILLFTLVVNVLRESFYGINRGYAPYDFAFNLMFFLPSLIIALILSLTVVGRTIKHWKTWKNLNKKLIFIGLSSPVIVLWMFMIINFIIKT